MLPVHEPQTVLDWDNEDQLVAFFNVMMCCFSESVSKEGKDYSQADGWFGPVAIANHLWPIFTGNNEMKEFKLYLLIKKFYFDSKLYKFISPSMNFLLWNIEEPEFLLELPFMKPIN